MIHYFLSIFLSLSLGRSSSPSKRLKVKPELKIFFSSHKTGDSSLTLVQAVWFVSPPSAQNHKQIKSKTSGDVPSSSSTCVHPTFDGGVWRRSLNAQVPRRVSLVGEVPHLQVADGEPDDGGLVQLAGDGARQRQHLGQLVKLKVLLSPPRSRRVPRLLLPQSLQPGRTAENNSRWETKSVKHTMCRMCCIFKAVVVSNTKSDFNVSQVSEEQKSLRQIKEILYIGLVQEYYIIILFYFFCITRRNTSNHTQLKEAYCASGTRSAWTSPSSRVIFAESVRELSQTQWHTTAAPQNERRFFRKSYRCTRNSRVSSARLRSNFYQNTTTVFALLHLYELCIHTPHRRAKLIRRPTKKKTVGALLVVLIVAPQKQCIKTHFHPWCVRNVWHMKKKYILKCSIIRP